MKVLLSAICFAVLALGCATSTKTPQERTRDLVRSAVIIGASFDLKAHPEREAGYIAARDGLNALVAQETWNAKAFASALALTGNDVFSGPYAQLALLTVPTLVDQVSGDRIDLSQQGYIEAATRGAAEGLNIALPAKPL
jgi:hypothetical protein